MVFDMSRQSEWFNYFEPEELSDLLTREYPIIISLTVESKHCELISCIVLETNTREFYIRNLEQLRLSRDQLIVYLQLMPSFNLLRSIEITIEGESFKTVTDDKRWWLKIKEIREFVIAKLN